MVKKILMLVLSDGTHVYLGILDSSLRIYFFYTRASDKFFNRRRIIFDVTEDKKHPL